MVYVDLNPFRAGMARTLKQCLFTSLLQRIKVIKADSARARSRRTKQGSARKRSRRKIGAGTWLVPVESILSMATGEYVSLVARTAGVALDDVDHTDRLSSLGIDTVRWQEVMTQTTRLFGTAVGSVARLVGEARRRGSRRVVNALDVYRV